MRSLQDIRKQNQLLMGINNEEALKNDKEYTNRVQKGSMTAEELETYNMFVRPVEEVFEYYKSKKVY